jgi:short-subunit dehydrogenase
MPTALVTGASAGIGAAFCRHLASDGYRLIIVARDTARLAERRATLLALGAPEVEVLAADLTDPAGRRRVADRLADPARPIDLLVNNAGMAIGVGFVEATQEQILDQLELNVTAVMILTHAVLPAMLQRGHGGIINVASIAGLLPGRGSTYAASKAWVIAFSEGLSVACKGSGVRVQALCPGFVRTEFHDRAGIDMSTKRDWMYVDIDEVISTALEGLRGNRPLTIPGRLYGVIAGAAKLAPRSLVRAFAGRVDAKPRT